MRTTCLRFITSLYGVYCLPAALYVLVAFVLLPGCYITVGCFRGRWVCDVSLPHCWLFRLTFCRDAFVLPGVYLADDVALYGSAFSTTMCSRLSYGPSFLSFWWRFGRPHIHCTPLSPLSLPRILCSASAVERRASPRGRLPTHFNATFAPRTAVRYRSRHRFRHHRLLPFIAVWWLNTCRFLPFIVYRAATCDAVRRAFSRFLCSVCRCVAFAAFSPHITFTPITRSLPVHTTLHACHMLRPLPTSLLDSAFHRLCFHALRVSLPVALLPTPFLLTLFDVDVHAVCRSPATNVAVRSTYLCVS